MCCFEQVGGGKPAATINDKAGKELYKVVKTEIMEKQAGKMLWIFDFRKFLFCFSYYPAYFIFTFVL